MASGFYISRLRSIGVDVADVEVSFGPGCTVISGASDTGKSYILKCLDYMLGGKKPPKSVKEDAGYETLLLELRTWDGRDFVLERSLKKGGAFRKYETTLDKWNCDQESIVLKAKHDAGKTDTVSHFLLELSGLANVVIRKTKAGKTRPLSFRDICRFNIIDETSIIAEESPVWPTRQVVSVTPDASTFRYLVSGEDSSSVIPPADIKTEKTAWRAQRTMLNDFIEELVAELSMVDDDASDRLQSIEKQIELASAKVADQTQDVQDLNAKRRQAWQEMAQSRSRAAQITQLLDRFDLLEKHYRSDLERMRFVAEGDFLMSQLGDVHCPMCGSLLDEHSIEKTCSEQATQATIQQATRSEAGKIKVNLKELTATMAVLKTERSDLSSELNSLDNQVGEWNSMLRDALQPAAEASVAELNQLASDRSSLQITAEKRNRLEELQLRFVGLGDEPKQKRAVEDTPSTVAETKGKRSFFDALQKRLEAWNFPNVGTVEFDEEQDLVVNGEARRTHGKGIRAVLQSAFSITLMSNCATRHPKFVVLDSPLTSFKEADTYQANEDVQRGFFESVAVTDDKQQVIVIENKEPDTETQEKVNYVHFSGSAEIGRAGFYPVS